MLAKRPLIFIMGVSGSGKSTIGKLLADALSVPFHDGDDYHPQENVRKMQGGTPLDDEDRLKWLTRLNALARELSNERGGVIACSALKEVYRQLLMEEVKQPVNWILLEGNYNLIKERMLRRAEHYMPASLLDSQFSTIEMPAYALCIDVSGSPENIVTEIMQNLDRQEIGVIGLGTMGRGLALNLADHRFSLALYNRHIPGKEEKVALDFIASHAELVNAAGFDDLAAFVNALQTPRRIILMVDAGAVDTVLGQLIPYLSAGDTVADCGNSHYNETQERQKLLSSKGVRFLGVGISGGEKGARHGPAIMPGGSRDAYLAFRHAFDLIAAKDTGQTPCSAYLGEGGAGHFVKMVHNGIEYAEMQLIAEVYGFLRFFKKLTPGEIAHIFSNWQEAKHKSYLLGITVDILEKRGNDGWLIDMIAEAAGSKGTGNWTLQEASDLSFPCPVIAAAVHARYLSGIARTVNAEMTEDVIETKDEINDDGMRNAFYFARLINHYLGFGLLQRASETYGWNLDLSEIARIWTNGCIIRSAMMEELKNILPDNILFHQRSADQLRSIQNSLSEFVQVCAKTKLYLPCHSAAFNSFIGITRDQPTGNLIQAQRDYFGAHGFQRKGDRTGKNYHLKW